MLRSHFNKCEAHMSASAERQVRKFSRDTEDVKPQQQVGLKFVVVRTRASGVHCGYLMNVSGQHVALLEARRVWRWRGANTLHELSQDGCDKDYSRISESVPEIVLLDALEVISCSRDAALNLQESRWPE